MLHPALALGLIVLVGVGVPSAARAQCADPPVVGSETAAGDRFGFSVDLDGTRMIAGAPREDSPGTDAGAAYVFDRVGGTWVERARLVANGAQDDDRFGTSVAVGGTTALVGATQVFSTGNGSVHAFEEGPGGWTETQRLTHSGGEFAFGSSVVLAGDVAIVAAFTIAHNLNAVYVFERVGGTWTERQRLAASPGDRFGSSLAFDGERLFVGATATRRVHVYERQGAVFVQTAELIPHVPSAAGQFGFALALDGDRVAVGANQATPNQQGRAYVFQRMGSSWAQTHQLVASDPEAVANFGASLGLEGGRLVVGAPRRNDPVFDHGKVYVFELLGGTWTETRTVRTCAGTAGARIGAALALDEGRAVLGAPFDNVTGGSSGATYVVDFLGPLGTRYCPAVPNSSGARARTEARGAAVVAANELLLETTELPPDRFGYYLTSMGQRFLPMLGGGAGNLCLDLPIVRFAGNILNSSSEGAVALALDLTALPPGATFLPGDTWSFQYWFRDVGNTSNTSDAVAVTFETNGAPAVQFPVTFSSVVEQATQLQVLVTLSQPAAGPVSVTWAESGTATPQVDYRVESPNPLVIPVGQTEAVLLVTIAADTLQEPDETVILDLVAASGGVLGTALQHRLTIEDDD